MAKMAHAMSQLCDNAIEITHGDPNVAEVDDTDEHSLTVVQAGTTKRPPLLVDSLRYKFCRKCSRGNVTHWHCSVRTKSKAVMQTDDVFEPRSSHTHQLVFGLAAAARVKLNIGQYSSRLSIMPFNRQLTLLINACKTWLQTTCCLTS